MNYYTFYKAAVPKFGPPPQLLRVMRITAILLLVCLIQVSAASKAQKLTFSKQNASLEQVFQEITRQTGYEVFYGDQKFDDSKRISVNFKNASLDEVLTACLLNQSAAYVIEEKSIIIKAKEPSLLDRLSSTVKAILKNIDVKGKVVDQDGKPLPNASIRVKGKSVVTNTNSEGEFELKGVDEDAVLLVSYVGFKTLEIPLQGAVLPLEIKLNVATGELEEVKVVYNTGYQELNKERATGSFVHIDNELFNRRVGETVLDRIIDLIPGMYSIVSPTTNPLDGFTIRGVSTLNASKRPLLVVDNFIFEGNPNSINPNDVESVTILRDAAAASIWGVRSGNGVIVITMKKGKSNSRPAISFNTTVSLTEKPDLFSIPIVSSRDVIALEKQRFDKGYYNSALNNTISYPAISQVAEILAAKRAGRISSSEADTQIALLESHDVRNDIDKYLTQIPIAQQYSLNISGGGTAYQYYGSVGYNRSRPVNINTLNEQLSMRFSNTWQPVKYLELSMEMNWGQTDNRNRNSLGSYQGLLTSPYHRLADENGNALALANKYRLAYVDTVKFVGQYDWHYRPLDESRNGDTHSQAYNTRVNGGVSYVLISGLKASINYQWQKTVSNSIAIRSMETFSARDLINRFTNVGTNGLANYPYPVGGIYDRSGTDQKAWSFRGQLNFNRNFGLHAISAILGLETRESTIGGWAASPQYGFNSQTNTFSTPQQGSWTTRPAKNSEIITVQPGAITGNLNRFGSSYGNIGYTFREKYTLTGSARVDESNFFGVKANDRKVPLWSTGLSWQISKEGFYKLDWLPTLRLNATYGYNGNVNAGTSPFATAGYSNPTSPLLVPFARINTPPNPQLRWERVRNINLALDFGTKNQRINGNIEFFQKNGIDLISQIDIDPTSGFTLYSGNESSVQTRGFDLSITSRNVAGLFKWFTTVIFGYQNDKVTAYTVPPPTQGAFSGILVGKPLTNMYAYRWAGLNPMDGSSRFYLKDQVLDATSANTNKVKQEDLVYIGQSNPPIFGALRNDLSFKNIELSFSISYQFGYYFRRKSYKGEFGTPTVYQAWQHEDYLQAWKVPGDEMSTNVPAFLDTYPDSRYNVYENSDILIEKGDHIRLRDIRLSFDIDRSIIKTLTFKRASFYIYTDNVGILWKASKYSPDTEGGLLMRRPRTFAIGLNASF